MKSRRMKIFQRQSDEVKIALLGYMKPVHGLPDHRRLFLTLHCYKYDTITKLVGDRRNAVMLVENKWTEFL